MYYFKDDEVIIQNDDDSDSEFLFQNLIEECVDEQEDNEMEYEGKITEENVQEDETELRSEVNEEENIELGEDEMRVEYSNANEINANVAEECDVKIMEENANGDETENRFEEIEYEIAEDIEIDKEETIGRVEYLF